MVSIRAELNSSSGRRKFRTVNNNFVIHYRGPTKPMMLVLPTKNFRKQKPVALTALADPQLALTLHDYIISKVKNLKLAYFYNKHVDVTKTTRYPNGVPVIVKIPFSNV